MHPEVKNSLGWVVKSLLVGSISLGIAAPALMAAPGLDPETYYEIIFALNNERAQTIPNVNVIDVVKIGSREFLVITPHGLGGDGKGSKGYVDLSSVRSILPALKFERR
ncbi:MAG: hypothetical protein HYT88_04185 [Candidatus Omnitrophica bacterium]|nr:hypothetical protein [Candidatus Omnitrophota bacterium]